jgi:methionyl-tRNA formyltransferase
VTRLVYLGTSEFAASVLRGIVGEEHRPVLVVTRPDAPRGRGRKLTTPPVAVVARELGIEVEQPANVNDASARKRITAADPEIVVVCAFGALIGDSLLGAHETLNVHPSLLPRWRGAAPIERAIMAGDSETGVSIMRLVRELDAGPVCAQERTGIEEEDDYGTLAPRLERISVDLLRRVLDQRPPFVEQDESGVTYAEKITAADRTLDLSLPAAENVLVVRALHPHIGARIELADGSFLGVDAARVGEDGRLELVTVQPPGGKPMAYSDYVRGHGEAPTA